MQCLRSPLSEKSLQKLNALSRTVSFHVIHNSEQNDHKRLQSEEIKDEEIKGEIMNLVCAHTQTEMKHVKMMLMKSLAGCKDQILHRDYDGAQQTIDAHCSSMLIPIQQEGACINVGTAGGECARVHCALGCALFWPHNVVHGGASYETENTRLFAYITKNKKCIKNYIFD